MSRLTVDLEPLTGLFQLPEGGGLHPDFLKSVVKSALACELAGVDGILLGVGEKLDRTRRKAISMMMDTLDIPLAVRAKPDEQWLETLEDLKPSMVIISVDRQDKQTLRDTVTRLQIANILVAIETPLEIEAVKQAAGSKCDYLVFDCGAYCAARTLNEKIDQLNRIGKLTSLASRLSIGTVATGRFNAQNLARLAGKSQIEEFIVGLPVITSSLLHGYGKAIDRLKSILP